MSSLKEKGEPPHEKKSTLNPRWGRGRYKKILGKKKGKVFGKLEVPL